MSTLTRKTPMKRAGKVKSKGLGHQVEALLNFLRPAGTKPLKALRSESHRRNVASLACVVCGKAGPSQCAHINFSKSLGMKACDSVTFPACPDCHRAHDQGGISRDERRRREWQYVDATRAELLKRNLWPASTESFYQAAIEPLKRVVDTKNPASVAADPGVINVEKKRDMQIIQQVVEGNQR